MSPPKPDLSTRSISVHCSRNNSGCSQVNIVGSRQPFMFGFELELARFRYSNELFQPILTRVYSHCNEKKFSLLWVFLLITMSIFSHRDKYSWEMYFPQNTDIKTSSNIFLFKAEDSWKNRENTGKFIKNSGRILPPISKSMRKRDY